MNTSKNIENTEHINSILQSVADMSCDKRLAGIAIGVIFADQDFSAVSGFEDTELTKPITASTVFEIGSISKVFTSLLLAIGVKKGEVALDDPVQNAFGDEVRIPSDGQQEITFRSLANHRSSLPRLPDDLLKTADHSNPYVHYDQEMLYACLNRMDSVEPIGASVEYSNLGVGLLGHVLGKLAKSDYRVAIKERVFRPLKMESTWTEFSSEQSPALATAHLRKGKPTPHWDFSEPTVAAGGIRSSLNDMLKFLRANVWPEKSILADELALMRETIEYPGDAGKFKWSQFLLPFAWPLIVLSVFAILTLFVPKFRVDFFYFTCPVMILAFGAALLWGRNGGFIALLCLLAVTWQMRGDGFSVIRDVLLGISFVIFAAKWRTVMQQEEQDEGRLAWQSLTLQSRNVLWHNGMVGGSASFMGVVEDAEIGVVVLTNTANSVDSISLDILTQLIELQEQD